MRKESDVSWHKTCDYLFRPFPQKHGFLTTNRRLVVFGKEAGKGPDGGGC
jgi:hypothetical protein